MIHVSIIRDTEEDLDKEVALYFRNYHPAGYGTMMRAKGKTEDGKWIAHIIRAESCD